MTTVSPQYYEGFRAAVGGEQIGNDTPAAVEPVCAESPSEGTQPEPAAALSEEERIKGELHPLDSFARLFDCAKKNQPPREDDQFRFRWFGLFYQGPRQDAFVLRLRLPGGRLRAYQLAGLAALTQELAGGCVACNAQGGLDIPGVPVRDAVEILRRVEEIGLRSLLSGGDCVQAVRGGEYEGLTDRSRPPVIYPLVRELEQACAMNRRLADLPAGCEVIVRGIDDTSPESEADGGTVVLQATATPADVPAVLTADDARFLLTVPGFGSLDVMLTSAQVVPACLELLGRWADQGNRAECRNARIAEFCAGVGPSLLREWLTLRAGPLAVATPDARAGTVVASPPLVGVPVPAGCLLSGALERLAEVARLHASNEMRLAGGQIFVPQTTDHERVQAALCSALTQS